MAFLPVVGPGRPLNVGLSPELVDQALVRILVGAPAHEARAVADPVAGDVVERDLADELRPQPLPDELLVGLPATRLARGAPVRPVRLELVDQLTLLLRLEPRCVADDVEPAVVVIE